LGLGERGFVAHRGEQVAGFGEWYFGAGVAEGDEAAALAAEGVGVFGDVSELVPAFGRIRVVLGCVGGLRRIR
jgi:hypothetical protein